VQATQFLMSNIRIVANLCSSDLFDRFPNLKIVSVDSGIGWVPYILEALEYQLNEMVISPSEKNFAQRRPREYFRDHIYVMFWFEEFAPAKMIDEIGSHNVLVETDFPHPTCHYPEPSKHFARVIAGLDPATRRRVLYDNAADLRGWTVTDICILISRIGATCAFKA
jgi:predicted TIM-barrel fold metal-dependent hydrolase